MKTVGIITEYNPFHNGHLHQLQEIRRREPAAQIICVMSGSFTQRGEAAILDKWQRAFLAVQNGVDLVLELPFVFSVRSAQHFAAGGVRLLDRLGLVDTLAFGTEYADPLQLQQTASLLGSSRTQERLRLFLQDGLSYPAALAQAAELTTSSAAAMTREPNTILALEYLQAIERFQASLKPLILPRKSSHYHDTVIHSSLASGTAIRAALHAADCDWQRLQPALPPAALHLLQAKQPLNLPETDRLFLPLKALLLRMGAPELRQIYTISEGLEYKLFSSIQKSSSTKELLQNLKSKRYLQSRLQRMLLYILLDISKEIIAQFDQAGPLYARVLAFNDNGRSMLRRIHQNTALPIITKTSQYLRTRQRIEPMPEASLLLQMLALDTKASEVWGLCFSAPKSGTPDFTTSPLYLPQALTE